MESSGEDWCDAAGRTAESTTVGSSRRGANASQSGAASPVNEVVGAMESCGEDSCDTAVRAAESITAGSSRRGANASQSGAASPVNEVAGAMASSEEVSRDRAADATESTKERQDAKAAQLAAAGSARKIAGALEPSGDRRDAAVGTAKPVAASLDRAFGLAGLGSGNSSSATHDRPTKRPARDRCPMILPLSRSRRFPVFGL